MRSRSTRFIDTCAPSGTLEHGSRARARPAAPPSRSRISRAIAAGDRDVAVDEHAVDRDERPARADRGRAERRDAAPAARSRAAAHRTRRDARDGRSRSARVGVVVEEHRHRVASRPTTAPNARASSAACGAFDRRRRRARRTARRRARRGAGARRRVRRSRRARRPRPPSATTASVGIVRGRAGEREHRPVVVGVGVHVDERGAARGSATAHRGHVASFGHVDDALEHARSVGVRRSASLASDALRARAAAVRLLGRRRATRCEFETIVEHARAAERVGFDSVWLSDHLFLDLAKYGGPDTREACYEPIVTLARARARRPDVRLGTLVLLRGAAARVGARQGARDARPRLRRPPRRRSRRGLVRARVRARSAWRCRRRASALDGSTEAVDVVKGLLGGGPFTFDGGHHRAARRGRTCRRRVQQPRPRVFVGGKGDRLLRLVAAHADGWNTCWAWTPDAYRERLAVLERACEAVGRDPATVWRTLGLYALVRRGRDRSRAGGSSGCAPSHRPASRRSPTSPSSAPAGSSARRAGARAGGGVGGARRRHARARRRRGAVPGHRPRRRRAPGCGLPLNWLRLRELCGRPLSPSDHPEGYPAPYDR